MLLDIERRASQWTAEARGELRKKESRAVLDRLKDILDGPLAKNVLPAGNLREGIQLPPQSLGGIERICDGWSFTDRQQPGREADEANWDRTQELVIL